MCYVGNGFGQYAGCGPGKGRSACRYFRCDVRCRLCSLEDLLGASFEQVQRVRERASSGSIS